MKTRPDIQQIKKGVKVEMEHTNDKKVALKIALDHLKEDPKYYDKLLAAGLEELEQQNVDQTGQDPKAQDQKNKVNSKTGLVKQLLNIQKLINQGKVDLSSQEIINLSKILQTAFNKANKAEISPALKKVNALATSLTNKV